MVELIKLKSDDMPKLPRHAKLRYDEARKKWIINAPERVFELDEIAAEIMQMIDGNLSINQIVDKLANKFENAPKEQISKDVIIMLQSLADKGFVIK
ncbi:MAG: pyrroloquinoline quinone biosynthesis peptide chaperone PqqD [Alphaproteobacteria bacterium TMED93]|jgi:pyrroloquinoline quinone biosynthesis protein D|nr:MAG: pyrroloquinoline quinone biosynthesis peptide chaperone PqqD [Alphaproteobacteria bacterium TMED93]RPH07396.1 MAG: pyrroloquinoline quinone biosynthesis peptide chaperone PqqD [Alphaproteobacteria bacterium TMED93]